METARWTEILTVIECGSLTAAADKLGYTLSGISRAVAMVEKELGFQMFYRSKKGVSPTGECEKMLPYIREVVYASKRLNQAAVQVKGGTEGEISIGTAYRHYYKWLTMVTSQFHEIYPGVHFRIYNGTSTEFAGQVDKHMIDFAIISEREGEHAWCPICKDRLVAFLPVGHRLAKKEKIPIEEFTRENYIATCPGLDIDSGRFFHKWGIVPNEQFSAMDIQATYAMVDAGMGISITNQINSLSGFEGICHREIDPTEEITIGLAWCRDISPVSEKFLKFILPHLP